MAIKIIIGLVFFSFGLFNLLAYMKLTKNCPSTADATIIEFKKVPTRRAMYTYYPVYSYTVDGVEHTIKSKTGKSSWKFHVGDIIQLKYNPNNPNIYYVPSDKTRYLISFGAIAIGVIFPIVTIMLGN